MDEAYPGDIIGVVCPGELRLGDTIYQGNPVRYQVSRNSHPKYLPM